jgi:hypothetical protein
MKKTFYIGLLSLALFEIANVYFIMPMPGGSQEVNSLDAAYFLYQWRWVFRILSGIFILLGLKSALNSSKWLPMLGILTVLGVAYAVNFKMAADTMFYQPTLLQLENGVRNVVSADKLVLGIAHNGQAKAYPIQFLGYHHQVRDSIGGKPVMVTYCTVCRTGRVFEPIVNGQVEAFRLVGMDHFNAMFEDKTTQSWWRQATGEAVTGQLKGQQLPEFPSLQTTLEKWTALYPQTLVMQPDKQFQTEYDSMRTYERGKLVGKLTRRDTASWQKKSWVIGIEDGNDSKALDWNQLQKERIIHDFVGKKPIVIAVAKDSFSFIAFERVQANQVFILKNDTLITAENRYTFIGEGIDKKGQNLKRLNAYQEYWHSWQTFHPKTKR